MTIIISWEMITAISTAATAIIALLTYGVVRWQWHLNKPIIKYETSCDKQKTYGAFSFSIEGSDKEKWFVSKVRSVKPRGKNIAKKVSSPENKSIPGAWVKEIVFSPQTSSSGIFFRAPTESEVTFKIYTSLKVKPSRTLVHNIAVLMH